MIDPDESVVINEVTELKSVAKRLVTVVVARDEVPSTKRLVPTVSPPVVEALERVVVPVTVRLVIVVVARLVVPVTESDVVARRVPTVVDEVLSVVISPLVAVKLVKKPDTTVKMLEKKLVEVAEVPEAVVKLRLVMVEEEIVVVARLVVPVA